jgi:hypothetical protein
MGNRKETGKMADMEVGGGELDWKLSYMKRLENVLSWTSYLCFLVDGQSLSTGYPLHFRPELHQ